MMLYWNLLMKWKINMIEEEFELDDSGKSYNARVVGKVTWQSFRYYTSLNGALKDLVHIKLSREKFSSLHELIEANNRVFEEMKQVFLPEYIIEKAK